MSRNKVITLFNKNHITLVKTIFSSPKDKKEGKSVIINPPSYISGGSSELDEIIKISPLGFYYKSKVKPNLNNSWYIHRYLFTSGDVEYKLSYCTSDRTPGPNSLRPWESIKTDKSIADHFINDLLLHLTNLIEEFKGAEVINKVVYSDSESKDIKFLKNQIFTHMFGFPSGPKYQTDKEKILSHGFDLKESFRKDKYGR